MILDFGVGVFHGDPEEEELGIAGGTPTYMAPEKIEEELTDPDLKHSGDIYSLGITAYELLTGDVPFRGVNWTTTLRMHLLNTPRAPSLHRPEIPEVLDSLILRCLSKTPRSRYRSAREVARAIEPLLKGWHEGISCEERVSLATAATIPKDLSPALEEARNTPTVVVTDRETSSLTRVVVFSSDPSDVDVIRRSARRIQPRAFVHRASSPSHAIDVTREIEAQVLVISLENSELNGLELASLLTENDGADTPRLVLLTHEISEADRTLLEREWGTKVLSLPAKIDEVSDALSRAASVLG